MLLRKDRENIKLSGVNTEKKKSTLVAQKVPKLYEHETHVEQKVAGGLGGAVSPLVGPWQGHGRGSGGQSPKNFFGFLMSKRHKNGLK